MELDDYIDHLHAEGVRLADTAQSESLDAAVPSCPGWTLRDLVTHIGGIHRWATAITSKALIENEDPAGDAVGTGPPDAMLLDWFRAGHEALVETLRAAPSDLQCFTFLPAHSPLLFWARRQAHETAIHRVDAQTSTGQTSTGQTSTGQTSAGPNDSNGPTVAITPFDPSFALDGIGEMLFGFAARPRPAMAKGTMLLETDDGSGAWLISFGEHGLTASSSPAEVPADATVHGSASELYLWLWNRPSAASVTGDPSVASRWRAVRVRWS